MAGLLLEDGGALLTEDSGALLIELVDGAPTADDNAYVLDYRETTGVLDYTDGQRTMTTAPTTWKRHAERPGLKVWWRDTTGQLVDLTGATLTLRIGSPGSAIPLLDKTTGITGAAGAGTSDSGTPNLVVTWAAGELDIQRGTWEMDITARIDNADRVLSTRITIQDRVG